MPRSHPPSLTTLAHRLIRDERLIARGQLVLVACSGGPDSTALLHALGLLRGRIGFALCAAGVDHGLRAEAAAELDLAAQTALACGVPFSIARVQIAPGGNLQARARQARHEALQREAARAGADLVALGHTADDRAETLLMRLLRGAGPRGLAVMPPRAPSPVAQTAAGEHADLGRDLIRPLLWARRRDVLLHCQRHELGYASDPMNGDRRFLRARVRHELIPLFEELAPGAVDRMGQLADMLGARPGDALADFGRSQRLAIARAQASGRRSTTVRVSGGRDVVLTFSQKSPVLQDKQ